MFIQTSRRVRDRQAGQRRWEAKRQLEDWGGQGGSWQRGWSHICVQINPDHKPRVPVQGNKASILWLKKPLGVVAVGATLSLTGECVGENHRVLEHAWTHLPGNQHQKGPTCFWEGKEVTESEVRAEPVALLPLRPHSHIQWDNTAKCVALPWQIPKALPWLLNGLAEI